MNTEELISKLKSYALSHAAVGERDEQQILLAAVDKVRALEKELLEAVVRWKSSSPL